MLISLYLSPQNHRFYYLYCLYCFVIKNRSAIEAALAKVEVNLFLIPLNLVRFKSNISFVVDNIIMLLTSCSTLCNRLPNCRQHRTNLLICCIEARSHKHTIPELRRAINDFGLHSDFFEHFCRISLLKHRSADARKYAVKSRLVQLTNNPDSPAFLSNYWTTQDRLGYSYWLNI